MLSCCQYCCHVVLYIQYSLQVLLCCLKGGRALLGAMMVMIYSILYVAWLSATLSGLQLLKRLKTNDRNSLRRRQEKKNNSQENKLWKEKRGIDAVQKPLRTLGLSTPISWGPSFQRVGTATEKERYCVDEERMPGHEPRVFAHTFCMKAWQSSQLPS